MVQVEEQERTEAEADVQLQGLLVGVEGEDKLKKYIKVGLLINL